MIGIILFIVTGLISLGYFFLYIIKVDLTNHFTFFWLALTLVCFLGAGGLWWIHRYNIEVPCVLSKLIKAVVISGCIFVLGLLTVITYAGHSKPDAGADYMVILGARVRGERITANLERRLKVACDYLAANPETRAILSGGQGPGEEISEAEAMRRYLVEKGISPSRLILEDQSVNTDQNLAFSIKKIGSKEKTVVLVSNDFHILRGVKIARKQGLSHVQGLGSPTVWYTIPNMYMREAIAVVKYTVCGQM